MLELGFFAPQLAVGDTSKSRYIYIYLFVYIICIYGGIVNKAYAKPNCGVMRMYTHATGGALLPKTNINDFMRIRFYSALLL